MTCTFFGHRDCPETIRPKLRAALENLIATHHVTQFYVGNQGRFDAMARHTLRELAETYPPISYHIVLAYPPCKRDIENFENNIHMVLPKDIETVPKRFAVFHRNRWMVEQADYVVTYVTRSYGGAAQFAALAERKGKIMVKI